MASRTRIIIKYKSEYYTASKAKEILTIYSAMRAKTVEEMKKAAAYIVSHSDPRFKLWIFREPRNLKFKASRYQQACSHLGLTIPRRKKRGANNGRTNTSAGLASQIRGSVTPRQSRIRLSSTFIQPQPTSNPLVSQPSFDWANTGIGTTLNFGQ